MAKREPSQRLIKSLVKIESQVRDTVSTTGTLKKPEHFANPALLEIETELPCSNMRCHLSNMGLCDWYIGGGCTKKCKAGLELKYSNFADGKKILRHKDETEEVLKKRLRKILPKARKIDRQLQAEEARKARQARKEKLKLLAKQMAELDNDDQIAPEEAGAGKHAYLKSLI